jgi:hypothetical protein
VLPVIIDPFREAVAAMRDIPHLANRLHSRHRGVNGRHETFIVPRSSRHKPFAYAVL